MGSQYAEQKNFTSSETQRKRRSWRSFQSSMKRFLQKVSPVPILSKVRDWYVDSVTVAASHINDGSLVHGPYIGASLQHSASRGLHREEDDIVHVARTLSKREGSLPRSASYAGTANKVDGSNWSRSRSHTSAYARASDMNSSRHVPSYTKTPLSVTYEDQ